MDDIRWGHGNASSVGAGSIKKQSVTQVYRFPGEGRWIPRQRTGGRFLGSCVKTGGVGHVGGHKGVGAGEVDCKVKTRQFLCVRMDGGEAEDVQERRRFC